MALMCNLNAQNPAPSAPTPQAAATAEFNGMVDQYFDVYFHFHPTEATYAGFHQYDNQLENFSQKSRDAELSFLLEAKQGAGYAHTEFLNEEQRIDLKLISNCHQCADPGVAGNPHVAEEPRHLLQHAEAPASTC